MGEPALQFPKKVSALDKLKAKAKGEEAKPKKKEAPQVDGGPEIRQLVDEFQEAKTFKKQAEAMMEQKGDPLREFARSVSDNEGWKGNYSGSWALLGNKHKVKVIFQNAYSINGDDADTLAQIVGDQYPHLFKEVIEVKVKAEVLESEELAGKLMELVGIQWDDFFEAPVRKLSVVENFSQLVYQVLTEEQLGQIRAFITQRKATLR